jgi:hypothetical protein
MKIMGPMVDSTPNPYWGASPDSRKEIQFSYPVWRTTGIYRMLIYLSDVGLGGRGFEWKRENTDVSLSTIEIGTAGTAILFLRNRMRHRATAPITSDRYALDIILISRDYDVKNFFCVQAPGKTWPTDPGRIKIDSEMRYKDESGMREPNEFYIRVSG